MPEKNSFSTFTLAIKTYQDDCTLIKLIYTFTNHNACQRIQVFFTASDSKNVEPGCHVLCQSVVQAEHLVAYWASVTLISTD